MSFTVEDARAACRRYYQTHRAAAAERHARYYAENREEIITYILQWQRDNPDRVRAHQRRYRARRRAATWRPTGALGGDR